MKNILITGGNGQLGSEFKYLSESNENTFFFTDYKELDITDKQQIDSAIKENNIDCLINCAAYTNVDKAEDEFEQANLINNIGAANLAEICASNDVEFIHVSTDYVFDGTSNIPYTEEMETCPLGVYGKTKRDGEMAVIAAQGKSLILRTSWLYSSFGNNFVKTMIRLGKEREELSVVADQIGTPTYSRDLAKAILTIIKKDNKEYNKIYHFSNEGVTSWYDFAHAIMEISNIECRVLPIESKDYPTKVVRPFYSVLNKSGIKRDFGVEIPHWRLACLECVKEL
jgi:dTDP-4-dehydrorhamnose reductase